MTQPDTIVTVEVYPAYSAPGGVNYVVKGESPVDVARLAACLRDAGFPTDAVVGDRIDHGVNHGVRHAHRPAVQVFSAMPDTPCTPEQEARVREIACEFAAKRADDRFALDASRRAPQTPPHHGNVNAFSADCLGVLLTATAFSLGVADAHRRPWCRNA